MLTEVLTQVLLGVATVGVVVLILTLMRAYNVLGEIGESSKIAKKRIKSLDACLDSLEITANNIQGAVNGFIASLEAGKRVKEKLKNFWEEKK